MSHIKKFSPFITEMIASATRKCFDQLPIVPYRTGNKILRRKPIGPLAVTYHPKDLTKQLKKLSPEFETEEQERRREKLALMKRRGKGPPKKGAGKRAKMKK